MSGYPSTKPGYVGHTWVYTRVCQGTRAPNLGKLVIPGSHTRVWNDTQVLPEHISWAYTLRHPGTKPGYVGHTRVESVAPVVWCLISNTSSVDVMDSILRMEFLVLK